MFSQSLFMALTKVRTWVFRVFPSKISCFVGGTPLGHSVRARPNSLSCTALILVFLLTTIRSLPLSRAVPLWLERWTCLLWSSPERKILGAVRRMEQETRYRKRWA